MTRKKQQQKGIRENNQNKYEENQINNKGDGERENQNDSNVNIALGAYIHCEGCEEKVRKSLRGFEGVKTIEIDVEKHRVTLKGGKASPVKVAARLRKNTGKSVELISSQVKKEDKKPQPPKVTEIVLKVYMHCEWCAKEIKKCIHKLEGVETVRPDTVKNLVTVKGRMESKKVVEYVTKKLRRHVEIVKQDAEAGGTEGSHGWQVEMEIEAGYVNTCFGSRRRGRHRRGRRLVDGCEIEKIVDVKKLSWEADSLGGKKDDGIFRSFQNYIETDPSELNFLETNNSDPESNPPPVLPILGVLTDFAMCKYKMDALIKNAMDIATSRIDHCLGISELELYCYVGHPAILLEV